MPILHPRRSRLYSPSLCRSLHYVAICSYFNFLYSYLYSTSWCSQGHLTRISCCTTLHRSCAFSVYLNYIKHYQFQLIFPSVINPFLPKQTIDIVKLKTKHHINKTTFRKDTDKRRIHCACNRIQLCYFQGSLPQEVYRRSIFRISTSLHYI